MGQSTEELNSEIAGTRQALSSDLDALQDKVSPSAIIERRKAATRSRLAGVKDSVMGSSSSATSSVGDTAHGAVRRPSRRWRAARSPPASSPSAPVCSWPRSSRPARPSLGRARSSSTPPRSTAGPWSTRPRPPARTWPGSQGTRHRRRPGGQGHRPAVGGARPGPGPVRRRPSPGRPAGLTPDQSRTPDLAGPAYGSSTPHRSPPPSHHQIEVRHGQSPSRRRLHREGHRAGGGRRGPGRARVAGGPGGREPRARRARPGAAGPRGTDRTAGTAAAASPTRPGRTGGRRPGRRRRTCPPTWPSRGRS